MIRVLYIEFMCALVTKIFTSRYLRRHIRYIREVVAFRLSQDPEHSEVNLAQEVL